MTVSENFSLKTYNTFGVEAFAKFHSVAIDENDIINLVQFAKQEKLPIVFLGGGSNVLFTKDYPGLVINIGLTGISEKINNDNEVLVTAKAGENWHGFVSYCLNKNYGGLENLSLIPGNVGTSPMQNIGAYGVEIKDVFHSCKVLNIETLETEIFNNEDCQFGYRESVFKREKKDKYVILEVSFKLTTHQHKTHIDYGAIKSELEKMQVENPSINDISKAVINIRSSKLPDPKILGNAGSFFKNPSIKLEQYHNLKEFFPEIPGYPNGEWVKVPAGWLIENTGWKGKQIGNVASHHLQALVLVNITGKASGQEIFDFSTKIIDAVKEKFNIELEREVNII